MGIIRRYWELIKLVFRYIQFKVRQSRLKTNDRHIITTSYGPIRGVKRISIWNDSFWSFEKIPFAKPPLGELRFKAPEPPDPWHMILDCTKEGNVPLQTNIVSKRIEGSEDCLYLNVYSKNLNPREPMPVMVWIYGGGFENGGATKDLYSPDYFMQKDVVLITINYRVGPFGFLSLKDPNLKIPGNAGLKDQVMALQWVQMNCILFGGNPENVTLFGESAGGASTHYMMLTERTNGLFHKAILMSGCALCPWAILPEMNIGIRLAKALGYNDSDNLTEKDCYEIIRNAKGTDLLNAEKKILTVEEKMKRVLFPFGPTIEPYITDHTIIYEEPLLMMRNAWSTNIPIIIGGTSDEGLILTREVKKAPQFINGLGNCENLVPRELQAILPIPECSRLGLILKKEYFNNEAPSMRQLDSYLDLMSYKYFWHPIQRTIDSRLKYSPNTPTYLYRFGIDSTILNTVRKLICGTDKRGACHADDLCYIFLSVMTPQISSESPEYFAIQKFLGALINFATYGNPNISSNITNWTPIQNNIKPYKCIHFLLEYDEMIPLPESEKLEIWDSLYPEHLLCFMSFDDPDLNIPGNAGLKDQVLALKWIKLNCVYFGGNPENITIFGESAGGASTHYMMLTERTKDLFHRAILMSGTSLCPWALNKCPNRSYRLAKAMGYEGENNDKLIFEYLKCAKGSQFLKGEKHVLTSAEKKKLILFPFGPVIEPYDSSHCVIPEDPRIMMRKAWSNQIPIIIGGTSDEGLLFYLEVKTHPQILKKLNNCTNLVPNDLNLNENSSELLDYGLKLRKMYFKDMEPKIENLHQYLELLSDKIFWHSIHRTILSRLIYASNASTYLYRFDVDSPYFNWLRSLLCGPKKRGVCHADDLGYLFLNMWSPMLSKNSQEYFAIQELISSFVSFAKYGNPNINSSFKSTIKWEPLKKLNNINDDYFNDLSMLCLNYNFNTKIIDLPEYQKFKLWDSFYPKEMLV